MSFGPDATAGEEGWDADAFAALLAAEFDLNDDVNAWKDVLLVLNVLGRFGGGSRGSLSSPGEDVGNARPSSLAPAPLPLIFGDGDPPKGGVFSSPAILMTGE